MSAASPGWLAQAQAIAKRYTFSSVSRVRHNAINLTTTILLVTVAGVAVGAAETFIAHPVPRFFVETLALGHLYFALHVLVIHEASHNMVLLASNSRLTKKLNRASGVLVSAYFGTDYVAFWEHGHAQHHRDPIAMNDPQNCAPNTLTGKTLVFAVVKVLVSPIHALLSVKDCPPIVPGRQGVRAALAVVQLVILAALFAVSRHFGSLTIFFSAIFGFGVAQAMNLLKISMEHGGAAGRHPVVALRSKSSDFALRFLVMPFNISMHFEHHLNATIPWYLLGAAHKAVLRLTPEDSRKSVYNTGLGETVAQMRG
jgi:fatty acid desaturase